MGESKRGPAITEVRRPVVTRALQNHAGKGANGTTVTDASSAWALPRKPRGGGKRGRPVRGRQEGCRRASGPQQKRTRCSYGRDHLIRQEKKKRKSPVRTILPPRQGTTTPREKDKRTVYAEESATTTKHGAGKAPAKWE